MFEFLTAHPYLTIWVSLALFFERAMYCGYVVDDDTWFNAMKAAKQEHREGKLPLWRLIRMGMYGAGLFRNAKQEHLFELILHGINCSLIYRASGSLLAAMLYLVNPINNQTTLWLNGRRYAVSIMLVLLAWNFWWLAPAMAFLCTQVHVSGMPFPLLFLWTPFWPLIPVAGAILSVFGARGVVEKIRHRKADFKAGNENQKLTWKKSILYVKTIGYQFLNCIFPNKPAMYHNFMYYFSQTEEGTKEGYSLNFDFWKGLAVVGLLGYLTIFQHSFWAFWFVLFISPWCNVYQVTMNASDRYCSLANVGVMVLAAQYAGKIPDPYRTAIISAMFVFYTVKYAPLFLAYRKVENFHQYHINQQPDVINPRFFLAKIYLAHKDPYQAYGLIRQGMRYKPHDFKLLLGLIECMFALGKPISALKAMEVCEKYIPPLEVEDCKNLFAGVRKQYSHEYEKLQKAKEDVVNRMTPAELIEEQNKIKAKTSVLSRSARDRVLERCARLGVNRIKALA